MDRGYPQGLELERLDTPCFVVSRTALARNLAVLKEVKERTGCRILLALKAFAMFRVFPQLAAVLDGVCASGVFEARLGREEFGGEVHTFTPAYSEADIRAHLRYSDHLTFNSFAQWRRFRPLLSASGRTIRCGIRVNPEYSQAPVPLYDPCAPGSRLGVRARDFRPELLAGISGLHFHTLCEQNADALAGTLAAFEERFAPWLPGMNWVNLGGGHHITRPDYDLDLLCDLITGLQDRYGVRVCLEPGEAVALDAGILVATVLDIVENDARIAILDTSAAAHMPDVLEMPYRPEVAGSGPPGEHGHTIQLAGNSCLAGDMIGDYSFAEDLTIGDRLAFLDMAHYTMVKTNTFNGVPLPAIYLYDEETGELIRVRRFGYRDFRSRLS